VGLNLGIDDADEKSIDEVMEVLWAARRESGITYVDFNTGHYDGETYLDILEPFIKRIKKEMGIMVGIQTPPHSDLKRYDALREMGLNRVSFCFEIFDPELFKETCPGKHREYGLERYLEAVRYCAQLGKKGPWNEPWVSNGEIIAGLEPPESSIKAIDWITSVGAIPTVCVFRPLLGTDLEEAPPPRTEDMLPVFRRLYEACMEKGLPVGIAPNINVSLVMLLTRRAGFRQALSADRTQAQGALQVRALQLQPQHPEGGGRQRQAGGSLIGAGQPDRGREADQGPGRLVTRAAQGKARRES
jgi:hypothetical protein